MEVKLPNKSQTLKLWEKIEIIVGDDDKRGLYFARIEDFETDEIIITAPEFQEGQTLLKDNCEVMVIFTKEDAVYQFYSSIRKSKAPRKNRYLLTPPTNIRRVQRRRFVRIELYSKVNYANIGSKSAGDEIKWRSSECVNISGGGMLIKSDKEMNSLDVILIKADIIKKMGLSQPIAGVCLRSFYNKKQKYSGIEFVRKDNLSKYFNTEQLEKLPESISKFDRTTQNKLVNFVFKQQIELRRKGLL